HGSVLQHDRMHCRGIAILGTDPLPSQEKDSMFPPPLAKKPKNAQKGSFFDHSEAPIGLGPIFRRMEWRVRGKDWIRGCVRAPDEDGLFSNTSLPHFRIDPILLDSAFQLASHWDLDREEGWISVPIGVKRVIFYGHLRKERRLLVEARVC